MTDTPQVLLAHHLKTLKLPTFLREYDKLARQCATEGADHVRYLVRLTELELIDRERRMVERRIRQARFPAVKSLDSFEPPHPPCPYPGNERRELSSQPKPKTAEISKNTCLTAGAMVDPVGPQEPPTLLRSA